MLICLRLAIRLGHETCTTIMPIVVARESNYKSNPSSFCIDEDIWFSHVGWSSTLVDEDDPSPTSQRLRVMMFIASIYDMCIGLILPLAMLLRVLTSQVASLLKTDSCKLLPIT